ncbi:MAG: hypothetical protein PHX80_04125 [Candidatus Nanoarchaeia archaeon]|nr:hypothetical protein [Candidatus Nanoarchaeia archaeon]
MNCDIDDYERQLFQDIENGILSESQADEMLSKRMAEDETEYQEELANYRLHPLHSPEPEGTD